MDSTNYKEYRFTDELGMETGKVVHINGQPALNRIQFFIVGVRNLSQEPISGEVWLDEFRLSGVNKDKGISMRVQSKFNFADIMNSSIAYRRQDADFHMLQSRLGSNRSNDSLNFNTSFNIDKFLPTTWGLKIPISANILSLIHI